MFLDGDGEVIVTQNCLGNLLNLYLITTGARDAMTSALQIVLAKSVCLDIAQVVRWKKTSISKDEPSVRYAASFAG
ncbi:hypothetical protein CQW23_34367 [Capsicum baccatum]|uniref:Uncharacterized protein n=1 Tax=Capsicum baccatum TaxID=33114 RepID=A0A2G2UZ79_CAPBA|nr:hypothetical protein CQW23_34367 [Capsicum baccatum]